jgi:hypothetical protein
MISRNKKNNSGPEDEIQKEILSSMPDDGIFFDSLTNKVSGKEKIKEAKIKKSTIDNYIMKLIARGRIYWKGIKLYKPPPTTHPPLFLPKWLIHGLFYGG